jgi:pyocin large subunit-like protein
MQTDIHQGNQALKSEGDGIRTRNHRIDRRFLAKAEKAQTHGNVRQFTPKCPVFKRFQMRL